MNKPKHTGFTIVELAIVIVIIGILAAITVVSYRGVTNKAHDAAVLSDLNHLRDSLELYRIAKKTYPGCKSGGESVANVANSILHNDFVNMTFSKDSYGKSDIYPDKPDGTIMIGYLYSGNCAASAGTVESICVIARSKSGQNFLFSTADVITTTTTITTLSGSHPFRQACAEDGKLENTDASSFVYGYYQL